MGDRTLLKDRLRPSNLGLQVSDEARSRHRVAIRAALMADPEEWLSPPKPAAPHGFERRVPLLAGMAVLLLSLAMVVVVSAQRTVPGDVLHPAKGPLEQLRALVDGEVIAANRVDELDDLIGRTSPPESIVTARSEAELALAGYPSDHRLQRRFRRLALPPYSGGRRRPSCSKWTLTGKQVRSSEHRSSPETCCRSPRRAG